MRPAACLEHKDDGRAGKDVAGEPQHTLHLFLLRPGGPNQLCHFGNQIAGQRDAGGALAANMGLRRVQEPCRGWCIVHAAPRYAVLWCRAAIEVGGGSGDGGAAVHG